MHQQQIWKKFFTGRGTKHQSEYTSFPLLRSYTTWKFSKEQQIIHINLLTQWRQNSGKWESFLLWIDHSNAEYGIEEIVWNEKQRIFQRKDVSNETPSPSEGELFFHQWPKMCVFIIVKTEGGKRRPCYFIWIDFKPVITCSSGALLRWIWLLCISNPQHASSMRLIGCPWTLVSLQYPQFPLARCSTDLSIIAHPLVCFEHSSSLFLWIDFCTCTEEANERQDPPCWQ